MNNSSNYPPQNYNNINIPANTNQHQGGNYSNYSNTITYQPISPKKINLYQPPPPEPKPKPKETYTSYQPL